jgi:hypothetical protein
MPPISSQPLRKILSMILRQLVGQISKKAIADVAVGQSYPAAQEILPVGADYLVELRGFEPLTSSGAGTRALDGASASDGIVTLAREERERTMGGTVFTRPRRPRATCTSPRRGARGVIELT